MPRYRLTVTAEATIEEVWEVEADSEEDAEDALFNGSADFISERTLGDEREREIQSIEVITPAEVSR